ncbi:hypothetical protein PQR53_09715 [Paraburkholderia fungorum]|uniref:hypothetical protein n=1 Tax=Paraburkholderia fungorum TaxID=134537 RepID=UPI0038B85A7A
MRIDDSPNLTERKSIMFSLFNQPARSAVNGTEQVLAGEMATQSATPGAGDERQTADRAATYEEMLPYLMLAMVTTV